MKNLILCTLCIVSTIAEPPVDNRYLPPQAAYSGSGGAGSPAQAYGPPNRAPAFGSRRQTDAVFGRRPSSTYGAPSSTYSAPSSTYGAPSSTYGAPSSTYGAPSFSSRSSSRRPSSQYGAPQLSSQYNAPSVQLSSQYSAPSAQLSSQYNAPSAQLSSQYLPPSQPSSQYGPPQRSGMNRFSGSNGFGRQSGSSRQSASPSIEYGVPSQQYGTPGFGTSGDQYSNRAAAPSNTYGAPEQSRSYLPPGSQGYGGEDDENSEPASYSFEYMVDDEESGNDFGHRESREGDRAEGVYYVQLPDGRKQTVEYEADEEGYKPRISYEDTGAGAEGYDRNAQALGGYHGGHQDSNGPY